VLLVWTVYRDSAFISVDRAPEPASQMAKALPPESRAEAPAPAPVEPPGAPRPTTATPRADADLDKNLKVQGGQSAPRAEAKKDARDAQSAMTERPKLETVQTQTAAAPPPPARTQPPQPADPQAAAGARANVAPPVVTEPPPKPAAQPTPAPPPVATPPPPPPAPSPIPPPAAAQAELFRQALAANPVVAEFSTVEADAAIGAVADRSRVAAGRGGGGGGRGGAGMAGAPMQAAESIALPRWRVLASGAAERSTDSGATWTRVAIDPPVHVINGSSSSRTSCWLIGRQGIVLLSTDGVRFQRVTSPTSSELSTIRATSARQSTVTTVDGRTFVTMNGGGSWRETKLQ
jgi:hypothetical protein